MNNNDPNKLISIFERIEQAYACTNGKYKDENITTFLKKLKSGFFFELPEECQIGGLDWFEKAYLGRGECLWGLIDMGLLPRGFDSEMRTAFMMHSLSMDSISAARKVMIRKRLSELLGESIE